MKNISKIFLMTSLTTLLCACGTLWDKDNTPTPSPLVTFTPEVQVQPLWSTAAGYGSDNEYLKLTPSITNNNIFVTSKKGVVTSVEKATGKVLWQIAIPAVITNGPATNENLIFVGTREGEIFALRQTDGAQLWKAQATSEILAPIASGKNIVLVKTIDGHVTAYSASNGRQLWDYSQTNPGLMLRGSSAPKISRSSAVIGFENGKLAKLSLHNGEEDWLQTVAIPQGNFPIQRMVDIDADPIIVGHQVFAATYQGHIAALDYLSGTEFWSHDISSYAGIASDGARVYASDARSHIWAFDAGNGAVDWRQDQLAARQTSGPAVMGNYVVVGDELGYLHWLSNRDGHFVARTFVDKSGILATPIVNNNILYVYSNNGRLAAFRIV